MCAKIMAPLARLAITVSLTMTVALPRISSRQSKRPLLCLTRGAGGGGGLPSIDHGHANRAVSRAASRLARRLPMRGPPKRARAHTHPCSQILHIGAPIGHPSPGGGAPCAMSPASRESLTLSWASMAALLPMSASTTPRWPLEEARLRGTNLRCRAALINIP